MFVRTFSTLLWAAALLFPLASRAQTPPVSMDGRVLDQSGAGIGAASVSLANPVREVKTDPDGYYRLDNLTPGRRKLTVLKAGFEPVSLEVSLPPGQTTTTDVALPAARVREMITVSESAGYLAPDASSGTKTAVPLKDLPQTVQVVNLTVMREQAALSMSDVLHNVSGVSSSLGEGRRDHFYIRGFNAVNDEYIDGVRDDALYYRDLSSIDRVEIVKGPEAALFGRGSSGGLVNRISKKPDPERSFGEITLIAGSYGMKRVQADLRASVLDGKLSGRLTGADEDSGSQRDFFHLNRYTAAPSLLWRPDTSTEILAQFDYLRDDRLPDRGVPSLNGLPAPVQIGAYYGYPQDDFIHSRVLSAALRAERHVGDKWTIRNVFRRTGYNTGFSNTYANGLQNTASGYLVARGQYNGALGQQNLFNQTEAVASGSFLGLHHTALAGFELGQEDLNTIQLTGTAPSVALINPILARPIYSLTPSTFNAFSGRVFGAYVQDQITWRRLRILAGVRRDRYRQGLDDLRPSNTDLGRVDDAWSPRLGLVYTLTANLSVYTSVSRTFDPSGEGLSLAANNADLKPESTRNLEAGLKGEFFGGRIYTSLSAFRLDRTNIKTTDPIDPLKLVLVGSQRTDGVEFNVSGNPWRRLNVIAGYAYMDPVIRRSNTLTSGVQVQGNQAGLIPRNGGSVWSTYSWLNGFSLGGGVFCSDRRFTSNDNLVVLPGYARIDAYISYRRAKWDASINLRNLLNRTYYETAQSDFQILPAAPINGLLTLRYRW